jgi:hypothetical protein
MKVSKAALQRMYDQHFPERTALAKSESFVAMPKIGPKETKANAQRARELEKKNTSIRGGFSYDHPRYTAQTTPHPLATQSPPIVLLLRAPLLTAA